MKKLHIYTDESGNSGENIFDQKQPFFWTGTIVSEYDFDEKLQDTVTALCNQLGVHELHGNVLGVTKINEISKHLLNIVLKPKTQLFFCRIEKMFALKIKIFDYFFDPGINMAVSPIHYNIRDMRIPLAFYFSNFIEEDDLRVFWKMYNSCDHNDYHALFNKILEKIESREAHNSRRVKYDPRTVELLTDALKWAIVNPQSIIDQVRTQYDLPNLMSMSLLTSGLNSYYSKTNYEVVSMIHDTQKDYGKALKEVYAYVSKTEASFEPGSSLFDIKRIENHKTELKLENSEKSAALQVVDVLLWITKKVIDDSKELNGDIGTLFNTVRKRALKFELSYESFREEFEMLKRLPMPNISIEQQQKVKEQIKELEELRKARMRMEITS